MKSVSQALGSIADEESGLVTTTSESVPGSRAGVKAVSRDPFPTSGAAAAAPPISTPASFWNRALADRHLGSAVGRPGSRADPRHREAGIDDTRECDRIDARPRYAGQREPKLFDGSGPQPLLLEKSNV